MFELAFTIAVVAILVVVLIPVILAVGAVVVQLVVFIARCAFPLVVIILVGMAVVLVIFAITNSLGLTKAHAQLTLPPVEYDKPYPGKLTVEEVTPEQLRARCTNANMRSLGCAFPNVSANSCHIILVDEQTMRADGRGWTKALMLRHERAHCNGWTQDHPGLRPYP